MAIVRYVVQTEEGHVLGQFPSLAEMNEYLAPRALQVVGTQRYARPFPVWYTINDGEYPSRMLEMDYDDIYIVRDMQEDYRRSIGIDISAFERGAFITGRWDFPSNEREWKIRREEKTKAYQLLLGCLNEQEKEELESFNTVTINTDIGLFRIMMDSFDYPVPPSFNAIYKGIKYCAVIDDSTKYPRADHFIAQLLLIRTDPREFLRIAHKG